MAFGSQEFDYTRMALREGRYNKGRDSLKLLLARLNGRVTTTTQRRLANRAGGIHLTGLIMTGETRGKASSIFCAVRVSDAAVGAAKVTMLLQRVPRRKRCV